MADAEFQFNPPFLHEQYDSVVADSLRKVSQESPLSIQRAREEARTTRIVFGVNQDEFQPVLYGQVVNLPLHPALV